MTDKEILRHLTRIRNIGFNNNKSLKRRDREVNDLNDKLNEIEIKHIKAYLTRNENKVEVIKLGDI